MPPRGVVFLLMTQNPLRGALRFFLLDSSWEFRGEDLETHFGTIAIICVRIVRCGVSQPLGWPSVLR